MTRKEQRRKARNPADDTAPEIHLVKGAVGKSRDFTARKGLRISKDRQDTIHEIPDGEKKGLQLFGLPMLRLVGTLTSDAKAPPKMPYINYLLDVAMLAPARQRVTTDQLIDLLRALVMPLGAAPSRAGHMRVKSDSVVTINRCGAREFI